MIFNSRTQLTTVALISFLTCWLILSTISFPWKWSSVCDHQDNLPSLPLASDSQTRFDYYDMDNLNATSQGYHNNEHVLILTPFKESARHIERYFENINRLTYPHSLISLGFLVSDSNDGTVEKLQEYANWFTSQQEQWQRFRRISIFQRDFAFELAGNEDRHAFEVQVKRRQIMAKSRNTLLSVALTEEISWVLWLDGDVIEYPGTLLEELIGLDKDIIVPNCYWHSYNEEGGYDKNNWQETPESWALQETLLAGDVLVEGYKELTTHRKLMIDMKGAGDTNIFHTVPLDGVGGTCTLVKAEVHRNGAVFPPFSFKHQVETEGLAKMAKALGYEVWGLPNYLVYHYI
ncbi:N-glycosyl-transferase [Phycomyces nitens]|nr:N-glycosyl-transferase [Phycomyces nitens]